MQDMTHGSALGLWCVQSALTPEGCVQCPVLLFFYVAALCVVAVLNSSIMDDGRGAVILRIIEDAPSVFYNQQSMSCLIHSHM